MKAFFPALFLLLFLAKGTAQEQFYAELKPLYQQSAVPFYFGVASGDPLPNSVVIWTKIIPQSLESQSVEWEIATDTLMQNIVQSGQVTTDSTTAFTVKVDVGKLTPGTYYFYRFKHKGIYSPIGRTKTAPDGDPSMLRFIVVSCADYQGGYYNAFGDIAKRRGVDAVVHLGDYIYEYGVWRGGRKRMMKNRVRQHIPEHTCTTLKDYRTRYGQYRLDQQLSEAHRLHPFIVIWDDHEIANNTSVTGPGGRNVQNWDRQQADARQAYFEWMPIRDNEKRSIVRKFSYGSLAEMWMLDGRLEGRSPQAKGMDDPDLPSIERHMLGAEQTEWMLSGVKNSNAKWKILGNQVIFSKLNDSKVFDRRPEIRMDRWDGYPAEQQHILDFFAKNDLKNIVVVTGDVHTSWAFELTADPSDPSVYDRKTGKGVFGAEFTTPSITSFNFDEVVPKIISVEAKRRFKKKKNNPHLRYLDLNNHGYLLLTLTPERATANWFFVKTKKKPDERVKCKASRHLLLNENQMRKR